MIKLNTQWVQKKVNDLKIRPSRENGQNFLINDQPIRTIIGAGNVEPGDTVLEIGPGLGALTESLLHVGARVTAIEFDPKLAAYLRKEIPEKYPHEIIEGDVLRVATPELLQRLTPYKLIANIPYHITSDIIRMFIESPYPPTAMCLLIQKEVAERLIAEPPDMNQLALFTQWFGRIDYVKTVPRSYFMPVPAVDSAIVRITPGAGERERYNLTDAEQKQFFSLIKRGFSHPRKQLRNNLGLKSPSENFDFTRRAETLTTEEWITLFRTLS